MRGLWLEGGRVAVRADLPEPAPVPGEVRVAVLRAGICGTDLALARGYMAFRGVPGHEFVGRALEGPLAGKRVVGEINAGCGECALCAAGDPRHCERRTVLGILGRSGAMAERLSLPVGNLHAVPDSVSTDAAVFVEPLAAAFEIAEQVRLSRGESALVAGDGRLGILCAWVLALNGLRVTVAGRHPERASLLPAGTELREGMLEGGGVGAFDLVVEATGNPSALQAALRFVRPRGTVVLKTTSEAFAHLNVTLAVVAEVTLVGSRCGRFGPALDALARDAVPVERLVEARFRLEEGPRAFERAAAPGTLKVLLEADGGGPGHGQVR